MSWVWSLAVLGVIKNRELKVLAVLEYMFHGSCRKVSRVLSLAYEPISKSVEHALEDIAYGAEMEGILEVFDEKLEELPSGSQVKQLRPKVPASSAGIIAAMRRARA